MPERWTVTYSSERMRLRMRLGLTSFKHVGIFPEQAANWEFIHEQCTRLAAGAARRACSTSSPAGGATLPPERGNRRDPRRLRAAVVTARENEASDLERVRWIVEDAMKFRSASCAAAAATGASFSTLRLTAARNGEKWVLEETSARLGAARRLVPSGAFLVLNLYSMRLSSTLAPDRRASGLRSSARGAVGRALLADRGIKQMPLGTYYRFVR